MDRRPIIGVAGSKTFKPTKFVMPVGAEAESELLGEAIAAEKFWLLCGGLTGVMEAVARGAKRKEGLTIGIIPSALHNLPLDNEDEWPSPYIDIPIFTGLGGGIEGRNQVIANSCDALIAKPGGAGTRSEIDYAVTKGVPVIMHGYWSKPIKGVNPPAGEFFVNPEDAVEKAKKVISQRKVLSTIRRERPTQAAPADQNASLPVR